MTVLSDVVTEVQRRVLSSLREETDELGANITAGATSLTLTSGQTLGSINPGVILQVDYELFLVTATAPAITVQPGYYGSTTAAHTAGAVITVNPRFPAVEIIKAVNETLDSLTSPNNGLFQPKEITLNYNPVLVGYDFTDSVTKTAVTSSQLIDVLEVRAHEYGPAQRWPLIPASQWKVQRQADTSVFPSGMALMFYGTGYPGQPLRVQYKAPYSYLVNAADDLFTVAGIHPQAHDIPALGATVRIMSYREIPRSFTEAQPQARRAEEVPVGASLTAMKGVQALFESRVAEERVRLDRLYPMAWR